MNATTLLVIIALIISAISWVVRYRYLNMYSRLPPQPQRKEPDVDLFPDTQGEGVKSCLSSYLDEFLSAIKIFGYLERPVFHELTRSMQTRKLLAGETLNLEQEMGYCLVVDGLVEIFVKSPRHGRSMGAGTATVDLRQPSDGDEDEDDDDDDDDDDDTWEHPYQLLTEVRNGAPMSSLFSIMSLFTEDVQLHGADDSPPQSVPTHFSLRSPLTELYHARHPLSPEMVKSHDGPPTPPTSHGTPAARGSAQAPVTGSCAAVPVPLVTVPALSLDSPVAQPHAVATAAAPDSHQAVPSKRPSPSRRETKSSAHPDILARATRDTTIAIIPTSAFKRLIRIYPQATAHIVHVILSRFHRVTLATAHRYLGLTNEVLQIERAMAKYTTCQLPNFLRGDALDNLKEKFRTERERIGEEAALGKGIALHNLHSGRGRRSGRGRQSQAALCKEAFVHASVTSSISQRPSTATPAPAVSPLAPVSSTPSPGDLLADVQIAHPGGWRSSQHHHHPQPWQPSLLHHDAPSRSQHHQFNRSRLGNSSLHEYEFKTANDDNAFRESILECIFRSIGLSNAGEGAGRTTAATDSMRSSPRLASFDHHHGRHHKSVLSGHSNGNHHHCHDHTNAFGFMHPFPPSLDGDTESVASSTFSSINSYMSAHLLAAEMKDEIEIIFFLKGSVLVEQGEQSPGLYYVVDGFLDIGVSVDESSSVHLPRSTRTHADSRPDAMNSSTRNPSSIHLETPHLRSATNGGGGGSVGGSGSPPGRRATEGPGRVRRTSVALIKPGGLAGYIGTISSHRSFSDIMAKTDVYVGFLPRAVIEKIVDKYPLVLLTMAKRLTSLLPRLIMHIDFALEWLHVSAGQVIFHENEESEAIFIVLNGRLRLVEERGDGGGVVGRAEFGQGESVGELEVLTESTRPGTVHAIRDTELVKFPRTLFNNLAKEHPNITMKISKIIASRMSRLISDSSLYAGASAAEGPMSRASVNKSSSTLNLRTVAILPVTAGVPVVDFGHRLLTALQQVGTPNRATSLTQAAILNHMGKHAFSRMGKLKLSQYLADLEEKYGLVVYVADTSVNSPWTQTCITQADCILLVGLADGSPAIGEYERFMLGMKSTARKMLVLIHADRYSSPGSTREWLRNRMWINGGHYHVQMTLVNDADAIPMHHHHHHAHNPHHDDTPAVVKWAGPNLKRRVQTLHAEIQKYTSLRKVRQNSFYAQDGATAFKGDFHRLARRLCGRSIGLVLGGGGARGIAQVGIIRAMEEACIPIDMVGGTSIGAFVGGLYARHADPVPIYGLAKKFAGRMASMWRFALDLTYPSASYTTGHEFNRGIFKTFGEAHIEDFWLEYYCNTTNISQSRAEFHTSGYAWRYIRASMSLAGLLPPLCDEGGMLLDGGYIDNLTVAHMKALGADTIFAIDVGALDDDTPQAFGDSLSGFWALVNRWNPLSTVPNPPTLAEIQARLAYVSSVEALERAKSRPGCIYMRPPIDAYGTLDFGKFDEIYQVGYRYGRQFLGRLRDRGVLPLKSEIEAKKALRRTKAPRRASI